MKQFFLLYLITLSSVLLHAQSIGIGTQTPSTSAILDITSPSKGILIPRMTSSVRINIQNPAQGLLIYQTDLDTGFYFFKGSTWRNLTGQATSLSVPNYTTILYRRSLLSGGNELWAVGIDGTNRRKVNIVLPSGWELENEEMAKVSANGLNIFLLARNSAMNQNAIYKCNIDGSGVTLLVSESIGVDLALQSLY